MPFRRRDNRFGQCRQIEVGLEVDDEQAIEGRERSLVAQQQRPRRGRRAEKTNRMLPERRIVASQGQEICVEPFGPRRARVIAVELTVAEQVLAQRLALRRGDGAVAEAGELAEKGVPAGDDPGLFAFPC